MRSLILALLMGCAELELLEADTADVSEMLRRDAGQPPRRVRTPTSGADDGACWTYVRCATWGVSRYDEATGYCRRCSYDACGEPMNSTGDLPYRIEQVVCRRAR